MLTGFRNWVRRRAAGVANWLALSQVPEGFFGPAQPGAVTTPGQALTLSPFWCGIRLYQTTLGSLPLVTYRKGTDGSRTRADDVAAFNLLHERPNPAMSRSTFFELLAYSLFLNGGEFFAIVRKTEAGELVGLYPVPCGAVLDVVIDAEWNKYYRVREADGDRWYADGEMLHLFLFSLDGIRGVSVLKYAAESLGLHRQVLESATGFYANAVRPSGYLRYPGKLDKDAVEVIKKWFKDEYAGAANTGKLPVTTDGGEFTQFPGTTADDARIIEALGASVDDVARWLGISPLLLYNLARGTYSNLGAENVAFYQRTIRPILDKIELEINHKVFGPGSALYCEFLTEAILRGDPLQQAQVWHLGITDGYYLRSEPRAWLNLPPVDGLDVPLFPQNMAPASPDTTTENPPDANADPSAVGDPAAVA